MSRYDFDLVVIGGGSGGVRAARVASALGARVALIEAAKMGGTCVNAGCIPKKLLFYAAELGHGFQDAGGFGFGGTGPEFAWPRLIANKDVEIARLNGVYSQLLEKAGVELLFGRAVLESPHSIAVADRSVSARYVLIATGSTPHLPEIPGRELAITSDDAFHLEQLPRRALLVGGGYIALEFAGIFQALGVEVEILHRGDQILRGFDQDVRDHLAGELRAQGIAIRCEASVRSLGRRGTELEVELGDGTRRAGEVVLFATGRAPHTARLGLDRAGVQMDARGAVQVDSHSRTSVNHIFAVGDCTGRFGLTPVAIAQGQAAARTMFGGAPVAPDLEAVPTAVFSQPAVAVVGLSEHEARARYARVNTCRSVFTPLKHRISGRNRKNLVKLVIDDERDRVLGCHMVGADAPEIIQGFAVALKLGVTKAQLDSVVGVHPTAAEEFVTMV